MKRERRKREKREREERERGTTKIRLVDGRSRKENVAQGEYREAAAADADVDVNVDVDCRCRNDFLLLSLLPKNNKTTKNRWRSSGTEYVR